MSENAIVTVGAVYDYIDTLAPFVEQLEWDNSGLLIGSRNMEIERVLICLDATAGAVKLASEHECGLMITHHPLIFHPLRAISAESPVYSLIEAGMALISAHTSLDVSVQGVNLCLAERLGLCGVTRDERLEVGMTGVLPEPMDVPAFAAMISERLGGGCRYSSRGSTISRVAVIGGGGGEYIKASAELGYDALVTGEAKHHEFVDACGCGCCLVAAGHFETEAVVLEPLAQGLRTAFPQTEFEVYYENPTKCVIV